MTPALMAAGRAGGTTIMIMSSVLNIMIPKEAWNKTSYKRYYIFSWFSSVVPDIFWDSLCVSIYIYIYIYTHTHKHNQRIYRDKWKLGVMRHN